MTKRTRSLKGDVSKKALQVIDLSSTRRYNTRSTKLLAIEGNTAANSIGDGDYGSTKKKLHFETEEELKNLKTKARVKQARGKGKKPLQGVSDEDDATSVQSPIKKRKQTTRRAAKIEAMKGTSKKIWNTRLKDALVEKLKDTRKQARASRKRVILSSDEDEFNGSRDEEECDNETDEFEVERWPLLISRSSPKQLLKAIEHLTPGQRRTVRDMGFGRLLSLRMTEIPQRLGHYVVDCFDDEKNALVIGEHVITIDENSIYRLLGVPNAGVELDTVNPTKNLYPKLASWRQLYSAPVISRSMLADRIANSREETLEFMIDFLVLFLSSFVECNSQGRCRYEALYCFNENTDISRINWCRYICNKLRGCKRGWAPNTTSVFKGPLPILTLLYVDNFTVDGLEVDREMAPISYWTIDMLKQRQLLEISHGGFGMGRFVGPSDATCWPGEEDNPVFSRHLVENRTDEDLVEILHAMLEKARETKRFIANNLGALVNSEQPLGRAVETSMLFADLYGHHPLAVDENPRIVTTNKNQASGSSRTGVTINSGRGGSVIERGGNSTGMDANRRVNRHSLDGEGAGLGRNDVVVGGEQDRNADAAVSVDVNTGIPNADALDDVSKQKVDDKNDSAEESFPGFGTQPNQTNNIDKPIEGKKKEKDPKEPRKPTTDPMFDLDISVPLASAAIDCLRRETGENVESSNDPFMEACLEINKNRLEWFDTESEGSDGEGTHDESQDTSSEEEPNEGGTKTNTETSTDVVTGEGITVQNLVLRAKEAKKQCDVPSVSLGLTKNQDETKSTGGDKEGNDQSHTITNSSFEGPSFSIGLTQMQDETPAEGKLLPIGDNTNTMTEKPNDVPRVEEVMAVEGNQTEPKDPEKVVRRPFDILQFEGPSFSLGLTQSQKGTDCTGYDSDEHETLADRIKRKYKGTHWGIWITGRGQGLNDNAESSGIGKRVSIINKYTDEEREVWNLIMREEKRGLVLFDNNQIYISDFKVLRSLLPGNELDGQLIDCMACVLNDEETRRGPTKPKRLFCSRDVVLQWMLSSRSNDEESRLRSFSKGVFQALGREPDKRNLAEYDMVFIPILEHYHYYLIVFDLMKPRIYLLDNICETKTLVELYDHADYFDKSTAYKVKHLFVEYLRSVGHPKIKLVEKCGIVRPNLAWSTQNNVVDCGIFTMRHMELFKGSGERNFECGFSSDENKQRRQIMALRKKYAARILLSHVNDNRELVLCEAGLQAMIKTGV